MNIVTAFTVVQIVCYQCCAIPGMVRIIRRQSSEDLSIWREVLILIGASFQIGATYFADAPWQLFMSPITSMSSVSLLLLVILRYRRCSQCREQAPVREHS